MAKGIKFFMEAQDESEFADLVLKDGNVVFVPQASETAWLPEFRRLQDANHVESRLFLQIWNKAICERLTVQQYAPNVFAANVGNNAPLIGFRRSSLHGTVLVAGELSAEMYALDPILNQFVYKGKAFEQWYNQLARWIRRHYERDSKYGMCIGPNAQQLFERGKIQLAQGMTRAGPV